jgi:16S rRNA (adenine1518-N6/adenine1519-N6)-dimethyltransferase
VGSIKKELVDLGIFPKKRLGQHFLVDRNILDKVIRTAEVTKEDVVLEVGPGLGEMTFGLSQKAKRVIAIEIDSKLVNQLRIKFEDIPNLEIHQGDILKYDFSPLFQKAGRPLKVVANLPYQISTPLLFRFLEEREKFSSLLLMLQKEVAQRLIASPGNKEYGPLSIFVQRVSEVSIRFFIKPTAFFPPPKVDSALVEIRWRKSPLVDLEDEGWFKKVVQGCFNYRRKTLINGLRYSGLPLPKDIEQRMKRIHLNPQRRPETLTIKEFSSLAEILKP